MRVFGAISQISNVKAGLGYLLRMHMSITKTLKVRCYISVKWTRRALLISLRQAKQGARRLQCRIDTPIQLLTFNVFVIDICMRSKYSNPAFTLLI